MLKGFKYRLYPSDEQKLILDNQFNGARFMYNLALETKTIAFLGAKKNLTFFDLCKQATEVRDSTDWLKQVDSQVIQCSLKNLDSAYTRFFKGSNFPKFKSKKDKQTIQVPQRVKVDFLNNKLFFPKIKWIPCIFSRTFVGKIKTCTISKTKTNKYYVSILVDNSAELPKKSKGSKSVGLDFGVKTFITTSDGEQYPNLKLLTKNLKRLRIEQRTLKRRFKKDSKEQSKNYLKQKLKVALLHEKIVNQRKDYLHKLSTQIINEYDTIIIEDLSIESMLKNNSNLSRAISETGWYEFTELLKYKADWKGKNLIKIGRFEPSSKFCNVCGHINKDLKLSDREWNCPKCNTLHDRDFNAAKNIKNFGLRLQPLQVKTS